MPINNYEGYNIIQMYAYLLNFIISSDGSGKIDPSIKCIQQLLK